jgi:hypothetical protein
VTTTTETAVDVERDCRNAAALLSDVAGEVGGERDVGVEDEDEDEVDREADVVEVVSVVRSSCESDEEVVLTCVTAAFRAPVLILTDDDDGESELPALGV